jgi:hypothetical protein
VVQTATCTALVRDATIATGSTWVVSSAAVQNATSNDKRRGGRGRCAGAGMFGAPTSSSMFCGEC